MIWCQKANLVLPSGFCPQIFYGFTLFQGVLNPNLDNVTPNLDNVTPFRLLRYSKWLPNDQNFVQNYHIFANKW